MSKSKLANFRTQARNANKHTERGLGMLEKSIKADGWIGAMTVAADGETFDGSARLEVLADAMPSAEPIVVESDGTRPVIVRRTDIASADDPRAIRLGLGANRIAQVDYAVDPDVLASLAGEVDLSQFWNDQELSDILKDISGGGDAADDEIPADVETRVKLGEVWALGRHRVACLDSLDRAAVLALLVGAQPAFVWADPPYGIDIVQDNKVGASNLAKVGRYVPVVGDKSADTAKHAAQLYGDVFDMAVQVWWGANHYADALPPSSCWIVWDKRGEMASNNFADAELAWCSDGGAVRVYRQVWAGMIREGEHEKRQHPTQKPVALAEWAFGKYGKAGDVIIDPFLGSGISVLAAERMGDGRTVYGADLAPAYCDVTIARWEKLTGQTASKIGQLDQGTLRGTD